jgi:nucleotide-binding universal stress UspA family protein
MCSEEVFVVKYSQNIQLYLRGMGRRMDMFKKMIVASELTKGESEVVRCLKGFRNLGTEKILLLRCLNTYDMEAKTSSIITDVFEENFQKQKNMLEGMGFEVETRVVAGVIRKEINRIAEEEDYSIIAAGSAKHTMLGEALFGGVAHELLNSARKPLLLIRIPDGADKMEDGAMEGCDMIKNILFATDFSPNSRKAFDFLKRMAESGAKRFTVVHVMGEAHVSEGIPHRQVDLGSAEMRNEMLGVQSTNEAWFRKQGEEDMKKLEELKSELKVAEDVQVEVELLTGKPAAEIKGFAEGNGITLVVMGSQGSGLVRETAIGSVSRELVRKIPSSVLLIPADRSL